MSETRETIVAIVEQCLAMDRLAVTVYRALAANAGERELAAFWRAMADDEHEHVAAWTDLLALLLEREVPQLFQDPARTLRELSAQHERLRALGSQFLLLSGRHEQLLAGVQLEMHVMHPALERLWHFHQVLRESARGPAHDYETHLRRFVEALESWGSGSAELRLLGEAVLRMWTQLRELSREASIDVVTQLLNRRGLAGQMRVMAHLARRKRFTAGAMMIDIDHFKEINDTHGHQAGDEVLASVARLIEGAVRQSDIVGRYGGEEFLVFLPQVERGSIALLGEKVRGAVEQGTRAWIPATVSVGASCSEFAEGVETGVEALIRSADRQLYLAKGAGRNTVSADRSC